MRAHAFHKLLRLSESFRVNRNQSLFLPIMDSGRKSEQIEIVAGSEVAQNLQHRILSLRHLFAGHGAADVDDEDDIFVDR